MVSKKEINKKAQQKAEKIKSEFTKHGIDLKDDVYTAGECQLVHDPFQVIRLFKGLDKIVLRKKNDLGGYNNLLEASPRREVIECMAKIIKNDLSKS